MASERSAPLLAHPVARVLLPFAAGYFFSYVFRSVNAVIGPVLAGEFILTPADLGLLTSAYFLAFAAFQLPLGLLLDRFGPRRTDAALLVVAASGALVFSFSSALPALVIGRALIGLGASGCLMSAIKANVMWFPPARLTAMNGWMFFTGGVGMIAATWPVEVALNTIGWRALFWLLAGMTMLAALLIYVVVPERRDGAAVSGWREQVGGMQYIFTDVRFWRVAVAAATTQSTSMAMQGLWAGPWFRDVAGMTTGAVASHLLVMGCATMLGFLFWGNLATRLSGRGVSAMSLYVTGSALFLAVQLLLALGWSFAPALLWMAFGFFGTAGSLSYAILSHQFAPSLAGRVNTALNSMVFAWAFAAQWLMGGIIGLWPASASGYHPDGYRAGFAVFLAVQFVAWIAMLVLGRRVPGRGDGGYRDRA